MSDGVWRPLGVETAAEIAAYDALREGIPNGMETQFWEWVEAAFTGRGRYPDGSGNFPVVQAGLAEHAAQALSVAIDTVRHDGLAGRATAAAYKKNMSAVLAAMRKAGNPLAVADFLLAHNSAAKAKALELMLQRSRSAWTVGERAGHPGLVRRVPETVSDQMDMVVRTSGSAGGKLAEAWEAVYGVTPNATHAYTMAIRAVEDAAIPVVIPNQANATLGHVIGQMRADGDWKLAFTREPMDAPVGRVALGMCQALWFGQHDRHGGVPSTPGSVSQQEAEAAVSVAVSLVHWFTSAMIARR